MYAEGENGLPSTWSPWFVKPYPPALNGSLPHLRERAGSETRVGTVREGFKAIRATDTVDATIGARAARERRIGSLKNF